MSKYVLLGVLEEEEEARLCVVCRVLGFLALGQALRGSMGLRFFGSKFRLSEGWIRRLSCICGTGT